MKADHYPDIPIIPKYFMTAFSHLGAWLLCLFASTLSAVTLADAVRYYPLPANGGDLVGSNRWVPISAADTLVDVAARYQLGYNVIRSANPDVDAWLPDEGARVLLPLETILPAASREGIVINVAEMRLYYYRDDVLSHDPLVEVYSISVGRGEWATPLTTTRVTGRVKDPVWYPPESIRREHAARGDLLPRQVPAGPDNPLGPYLLSLGIPSYFIHGTNKRFGIGMQVTHGCIRMYPQDIERLVEKVPNNTPVTIVNQPFKAGWRGDELYLEVHRPLEKEQGSARIETTAVIAALVEATRQSPQTEIDWDAMEQIIAEARGIPQRVGVLPAQATAVPAGPLSRSE